MARHTEEKIPKVTAQGILKASSKKGGLMHRKNGTSIRAVHAVVEMRNNVKFIPVTKKTKPKPRRFRSPPPPPRTESSDEDDEQMENVSNVTKKPAEPPKTQQVETLSEKMRGMSVDRN